MTTISERVEQLLNHVGAGEAEAAAALFAHDVDFLIPHDPGVWWIPTVTTRSDLATFFSLLASELVTEAFELEHVVIDGEHAVLTGTMTDTIRRTGRTFTSRFFLHLTQQDGMFTRYHLLEDTAAIRDALTAAVE